MDALELHAAYVKERTGADVLMDPEGRGFASWKAVGDEAVYVVDVYVIPECRRNGVAKTLVDRIAAVARDAGAKRLLGSVDSRAENRTESITALLGYGMRLDRVEGPTLWLSKELG